MCKDANYINIVQFKIQRYNELKHRATTSLESCQKMQRKFYISEQLSKDTETKIDDIQTINK